MAKNLDAEVACFLRVFHGRKRLKSLIRSRCDAPRGPLRIDGRLQARAVNVQNTVNAVEAFLGRRPETMLPMSIGGALNAAGRISGTITAPTLTASLQAPSLAIGDARGIAVAGELAYRTAALDVHRLDVTWHEATATASGTIGLRGRRALVRARSPCVLVLAGDPEVA